MNSLYCEDCTVGTRSFSASLITRRCSMRATWSCAVACATARRARRSRRTGAPSRCASRTQPASASTFFSSGPTGIIANRSRSSASQI